MAVDAPSGGNDHSDVEEEEADQFITADDILAEVPDDGDRLMDDDDDGNDDNEAGDVPTAQGADDSLLAFKEHQNSVFTVSCHPTQYLAASGGQDDLGYLWDIVDGEVLAKLTGHTDSVTVTAFSSDGEMISTGGMDGKIRIWRRVGRENYRNWDFLTELQGPDEVMVCFDSLCIHRLSLTTNPSFFVGILEGIFY